MLMQRRAFLSGLGAILAAPAIVRASSLMPVRAIQPSVWKWYSGYEVLPFHGNPVVYGFGYETLGVTPDWVVEAAKFPLRQLQAEIFYAAR